MNVSIKKMALIIVIMIIGSVCTIILAIERIMKFMYKHRGKKWVFTAGIVTNDDINDKEVIGI